MRRGVIFVTATLLLALLAAAAPAHAQLKADPSIWAITHESVKVRQDEPVDLHTVPEEKPIDPYAFKKGLAASIGLYEYKPPTQLPGYNRPHYALGFHSELMRDALSLTGLEADSCVAPMIRFRARPSSVTGSPTTSLTVFARCSFH